MRYSPKTSAQNLSGSATEVAQAIAADHEIMCDKLSDIEAALASGAVGVIGGTWYFGDGLPPDSLGKDGDLYLHTATADVYAKENGTWA